MPLPSALIALLSSVLPLTRMFDMEGGKIVVLPTALFDFCTRMCKMAECYANVNTVNAVVDNA